MKFITKIISRIGARIDVRRINRVIAKGTYKYIHFLYHDKFSVPFVEFLNRNFPSSEHLVLCRKLSSHPFPKGENVFEIRRYKGLNLKTAKIEKIICHSLFDTKLVDFLYVNKALLKKAYWAVWGGDLYNAPRDEKNDFVRRNVAGCLSTIDKVYAVQKYGMIDNFFPVLFYHPISYRLLDKVADSADLNLKPKVQINNSCDESTLFMLEKFAKYAGNIQVTTVLSYGEMKFKNRIIAKGREIFGSDFEYIDEYLSHDDYARYLVGNDILVLNQARQQGVGNIAAMLYLRKKVFIRGDQTTYSYLKESGVKIFDTNEICKLDFGMFVSFRDEDAERNAQVARRLFFDEMKDVVEFNKMLQS